MAALKAKKIDVLTLFAERSTLFYYDPSSIWRLSFDFKQALENLKEDEFSLEEAGRQTQREYLRLKNKQRWLLLEMQQPTLTVIKNFKSFATDLDGDLDMADDMMFSPKKFCED